MIDLTDLKCSVADPTMLEWAALMEPALGGVTQKVARVGTRFSLDFETPDMEYESAGRRTSARLQRAQREGGRVRIRQPGFKVGSPGAPLVSGAHSGGMTLLIEGATPRYAVREGQALNLIVNGRYYLYFASAPALLDGSGAGEIGLTTPMRKHMTGGENVELAKPCIEGWLSGNNLSWQPRTDGNINFAFSVAERA
ncbi:MAG: hypothetical protein VYD90_12855 [Pseudomonadota bacterium]|nr:hypothetical protein [Pseudomonadota bacterium]